MSDLQCALTAVLLNVGGDGRQPGGEQDVRAQRIAAVVTRAADRELAGSWARDLDVPLREIDAAQGLLADLVDLADEFRGETVLVLVSPAELAGFGVRREAIGAQLLLDADDARIQPWPVAR